MQKPPSAHGPYNSKQWVRSGPGDYGWQTLVKLKYPEYMQYLEGRISMKFQISYTLLYLLRVAS